MDRTEVTTASFPITHRAPMSTSGKKPVRMTNFIQCDVSCLAQINLSMREVMMHSKDRLANALREAGLPLMAKKATAGVYSNGLSLHALPEMVLRRDLEDAHSTLASALLWRVDKGEFEATDEELDAGNEQMLTGMILAQAQKSNTPWEPDPAQ
ncbi:hypothetical protein [Bradyrhizobium sp.]|jgi:hypothetical protein|uniref:hypothetical protein n=1 Tax=Bradyrhizobium sp. TaxID=376 RepID=UPI003C1D97D2